MAESGDKKDKKFEEFDNLQELDAGEVGDLDELEALCRAAWECKPHNRRLVGLPAPRLMALVRALRGKKGG